MCNLISGFGYHLIRPLEARIFGVFTICTTRCGFVNSVFGFAARKASRHQLHKHVNAHVYLGVLAYYAKQRSHEYVCAGHRVDQQVDRPKISSTTLWSQIGVCNLISGFGYHLIRPLEARIFGVFTICTTRCGFVNSVFGFAARKVSRHQLHKHVNAHVYLGVWRITLNSVQAVVGIHMIMSNRLRGTTFVFPDLGSPNWILRIAISSDPASGSTYSRLHLFRVRWKWPFGCRRQRQV